MGKLKYMNGRIKNSHPFSRKGRGSWEIRGRIISYIGKIKVITSNGNGVSKIV